MNLNTEPTEVTGDTREMTNHRLFSVDSVFSARSVLISRGAPNLLPLIWLICACLAPTLIACAEPNGPTAREGKSAESEEEYTRKRENLVRTYIEPSGV